MAAPSKRFPRSGVDLVEHQLRVDAVAGREGKKRGRVLETLLFNGRMTLQRGEPYLNDQGRRQIDFTVTSWVASAFSRVLGREIQYILSERVKQPVSRILSEQDGRDFPATFEFNVIFDARVGNETIIRRHHGRPEGHGFRTVPPGGNRRLSPTITSFEDNVISVKHPELGTIAFVPKDCNDRSGRTVMRAPRVAG
jgi:hypothetical protein